MVSGSHGRSTPIRFRIGVPSTTVWSRPARLNVRRSHYRKILELYREKTQRELKEWNFHDLGPTNGNKALGQTENGGCKTADSTLASQVYRAYPFRLQRKTDIRASLYGNKGSNIDEEDETCLFIQYNDDTSQEHFLESLNAPSNSHLLVADSRTFSQGDAGIFSIPIVF